MQADDETLCSPITLSTFPGHAVDQWNRAPLEYLPDSTQRTVSVVRPRQIAQVPIYELASHLGFRNVDQILHVSVSSRHTPKKLVGAAEKLARKLEIAGRDKKGVA